MFYEYGCDTCGLAYEYQTFTRIGQILSGTSCTCGGPLLRRVSLFNTTPAVEPYWNHSVGAYVTSNKDFEAKLKAGADEASERLGTEHRYSPMYPSEARAQFEKTASNDGNHGESVERYNKLYHVPSTTRIIT